MAIPSISEAWSSLIKHSALVLALKVAGALGGYAFTFIAIKYFGLAAYGEFELAFTMVFIMAVLAKWGYDGVLLRELPAHGEFSLDNQRLQTAVLRAAAVMALAFSGLIFLLRFHLASLFDMPGLAEGLKPAALLLLPWTLMLIHAEVHRARGNMVHYGLRQSSMVLGLAAITIWFWPREDISPMWYILIAVLPLLSLSGMRLLMLGQSSWSSWKAHRKTATAMFLSGILFMVMSWSDTLLVGYYMDAADVGLYRVAFKVATLITFTQFAVNAKLAPDIAALWAQNKPKELQSSIHRVAWLNATIAIPATLMLWIFGPWMLGLFGEAFIPLYPVMMLLCIGQLVNALCGPVMYLLNMTGHEAIAQRTMLVAMLVNLMANVILIPLMGLMGAAIATSLSMVLWNVWALVAVRRHTGIRTLFFWR